MKMTDHQERQLKSIISELAEAAPRASVALQATSLLVEITAWAHVLARVGERLIALDLDMEVQAGTTVTTAPECPGEVAIRYLEDFRAPSDLSGLFP